MLPDNVRFAKEPGFALKSFLEEQSYSQLMVLVDEHTDKFCYPVVANDLPEHIKLVIPSGEENKILRTCEVLWQKMTDQKLDRHALIIVLGGGVLGDMGGFCAATYKRGIRFILVPTTLLAQVDASIGGKLGIDFNHFKNHIGVFQLPLLTLISSVFLKTLPENELRSGFAEVIKHILTSDKTLWETIRQKSLSEQPFDMLIEHSVSFKARVVTEDPTEKGLRKILNAGHTLGHALESYFIGINQRVLHGDAIAVGLVAEAYIACKRNLLEEKELNNICHYILNLYGKIELTEEQIDRISELVIQDKKNRGNKILCVLQQGIGGASWDNEISIGEVKDGFRFYQNQTS